MRKYRVQQVFWMCLTVHLASGLVGSSLRQRSLEFEEQPEDVVVAEDGSAVFNCRPSYSSTSATTGRISWRYNGVTLITGPSRELLTNGSLLISGARRADEGDYQCQVILPGGGHLLSKPASLQLAELESADRGGSTGLTLFLGQTARFPCGVRAQPAASIQWLKDDQPLQLDATRMLVLPSHALEMDTLELADAGRYSCRASNSAGTDTGPTHRLHISVSFDEANEAAPPTFVATPSDTSALRGHKVTLDCAANGNPQPRVTWLKDGNTIDMSFLDRRFFQMGVSSLQIVDVRSEDTGSYQCRAVNSVDSADSSAVLQVLEPPDIVVPPVSVVAVEKEDTEMTCEARGTPQPSVFWTKDGELLHQSKYFKMTGTKLRILGLVSRDSGIYQCFATNSIGAVQSAAQLTVLPAGVASVAGNAAARSPPVSSAGATDAPSASAPSIPRNLTALLLGTRFVALTWRRPARGADAETIYSVIYQQTGSDRERIQNVTSDVDSPSLQVQDLLPDTEYVFRVVALSSLGARGRSSATLRLKTEPEPTAPAAPDGVRVAATGTTQLLVSWEPLVPSPLNYTLFVEQSSGGRQLLINTSSTEYLVTRLHKYTEYRVQVYAVNSNGRGATSAEQLVRTWSDTPSETPQNVTVETVSDTSVLVRWLPPPVDHWNGQLTGYKLRYWLHESSSGRSGPRRPQTVVKDAASRSHQLTDLLRQAQYVIKLAAITVNGTGPYTHRQSAQTFNQQQVEIRVPDRPTYLRARPKDTSVTVLWSPPSDQGVRVRGYTIGWGRGVPDSYTEVLGEEQRYYVIRDLQPSAEYVISVRALNAAGNGTPVYETLWTRAASGGTDGQPAGRALSIPTGLKVSAVSEAAVVLHWTDRSLPNQEVTDGRIYRVRYNQANQDSYSYYNSSNLNCMIDGLKPATTYEFTVQAVQSGSQSDWSLIQVNQTRESLPGSAPRDLTIVQSDDNPSIVNLNWQPPKTPNGKIDGYLIQYSRDRSLPDREWMVHPILGGQMTTTLSGLSPSTIYWFRIQARNSVGNSPMSRPVKLHTTADTGAGSVESSSTGGMELGDNLVYVVVACAAILVLIVSVIATLCVCKRNKSVPPHSPRRSNKSGGYMKGQQTEVAGSSVAGSGMGCGGCTPDLKPPDLWIHHQDQMELRPIEKRRSDSCSTLRRHSRPDLDSVDARSYVSSTLDRRHAAAVALNAQQNPSPPVSTVTGSCRSDDFLDMPCQPRRSIFKPKPIVVPSDRALVSTSALLNGGVVETRPLYPRSQFSIARGLSSDPPPPPAPTAPESHYGAGLGLMSASSSEAAGPAGYPTGPGSLTGCGYTSSAASSADSGSLHKRLLHQLPSAAGCIHPLNSFGVPPPPPTAGSSAGPLGSSPLRRPPAFACAPRPGDSAHATRDELLPLRPSYSTEELTQEMANLEGLMKDLSAITASEFQC